MILVEGSFRIPPANLPAAREAMARAVVASRAEDGCIAYSYGEDLCDPGRFIVLEKWESRAALDAHFQTAHMARWVAERASLGFGERSIRLHETGGGEAV